MLPYIKIDSYLFVYVQFIFISPPPLVENRISNITDIMDNKTTKRNISTNTSNQRQNRITEKSKKLAFMIGDSMIKDVNSYLLAGSLNRKYVVKARYFSSSKTSDMEYNITPTKRGWLQFLARVNGLMELIDFYGLPCKQQKYFKPG